MKKIFFLFIVLATFESAAFPIKGRVERGFEALEIYNYFKAKQLFEKSLKRHAAPASYGLAIIYCRRDNPFHSLDSAYRYVNNALEAYKKLDDKRKERYKTLGVEFLAIIELQREVSSGFYEIALREGTEDAFHRFVKDHPWAIELSIAVHKRDSIGLMTARNLNNSAAFMHFMQKYPESIFFEEAQKDYYRLQYLEATVSNTLASYIEFIKRNSDNPYCAQAEDRIYEISTQNNTIDVLYLFIKTYPANRNVGEAWRKLYQLFMIDFTDDKIQQFIKDFPDYPYTDEISNDLKYSRLQLLPYKDSTLFGFMDYSGERYTEAMYENLGFFKEGLALAVKDGKYGFIDKGNRTVIPFIYDNASDFEQGRAIVELEGKMGMIDRTGRRVFECEFNDLGPVSEGLVYGNKSGKYGYYEKNGTLRIEEKYEEAYAFADGMAKVELEGKQAFIDQFGTYIVPPGYGNISFFNDSLLVFEEDGLYGLMRRNCSVVQPAQFEEIGSLYLDRALIVMNDLFGYLDGKGNIVLQPVYELYPNYLTKGSFRSNYAVVRMKGKFGIIDRNGKTVIPCQFSEIGEFSNLIAFSKGKSWGYIDPIGKEVIKPEYDRAESFISGQAIAEKLSQTGVIDLKNKIVVPFSHTSVDRLGDQFYLVSSGSKFGVYDQKGNMIVPVEYEQVRKQDETLLILTVNGEIHYFYISENRIIRLKEQNE